MRKINALFLGALAGSSMLSGAASAESFNIPGGTLASALVAYSVQSGLPVAISAHELDGVRTKGVSGAFLRK
jgi:hypothetical protein